MIFLKKQHPPIPFLPLFPPPNNTAASTQAFSIFLSFIPQHKSIIIPQYTHPPTSKTPKYNPFEYPFQLGSPSIQKKFYLSFPKNTKHNSFWIPLQILPKTKHGEHNPFEKTPKYIPFGEPVPDHSKINAPLISRFLHRTPPCSLFHIPPPHPSQSIYAGIHPIQHTSMTGYFQKSIQDPPT